MRFYPVAAAFLALSTLQAQTPEPGSAMHWRQIGPVRAGRARAVSGIAKQPNVAYIGFDNGGVWRSTDYGSNWVPLFDSQTTGSIGAIAVAPSDPNIIYVGSGAGIIRPDLATGDGLYKSTDAGKTWTNLGLHDTQMIAMIDVDPANPDRIFVAALGHPYGPNAERGIFRSLDGGKTFQKVLYKDEYTSGNDVRISPANPSTVYATLWQQQQAYYEGGGFGGGGNGIFKSTDGGTTWRQITEGLPSVLQANIAISASNPDIMYAMVAPATATGGSGPVAFYKSTDAGEHWFLAVAGPNPPAGPAPTADPRPLGRIGGGDLPTIAIDPTNPDVVYSASTVMWRTEDGGLTWSAVRGAPGGDDYQKIWINPEHPNIVVAVADQGGVVSANRGLSWSNWYTQPTAAMYHVTVDNGFPYMVCGGQQDSGSACVASRSMDGQITFHDWHPVNIQEYGIAAPDPSNPDMVFGSARTSVSLYNRKTGQTTQVGPDANARGTLYGRNVRTMPILWSPVKRDVLFYTSNVVWKTVDKAHTWTRISPDLSRGASWTVPASAGKYAAGITPAAQGAITALSASPRNLGILWAGTDDGNIQVTTNGGTTWSNVTPAAIKPWTRIFNIEAGHFDNLTAYAAANTMRIDDMNPHFWRTHDGGKTWTEINTGLAPGAVSNAIREDPRVPGLLYAATETQVWVSYDDGDHWQSIRRNMPAISVRDIQVKDDSTCLCADLVAGTHGRGFWILDNLTPFRQEAALRAAAAKSEAYLVKPATAVRVRFGTNEPTPWPPELPAGENPLPGGVLDYYLPAGVQGLVSLDILDTAGKVVRSYSSADPVLVPEPGVDMAGYDQVCRRRPTATYCGLPLYWPAAEMKIRTEPGMHRVWWDLHFEPFEIEDIEDNGDEQAVGAVPHRTYPQVNAPWAPAGQYTVRLTVNGKHYSQPLTLKLDPRVKTSAAALLRLNTLSKSGYDVAVAARNALAEGRALSTALGKLSGSEVDALKAQVDSVAPPPSRAGRARFFGRGPAGPPTLESASNGMMGALMPMQGADVAPTAAQEAALERARTQANQALTRWNAIRSTALPAFNARRKTAGQPEVAIP